MRTAVCLVGGRSGDDAEGVPQRKRGREAEGSGLSMAGVRASVGCPERGWELTRLGGTHDSGALAPPGPGRPTSGARTGTWLRERGPWIRPVEPRSPGERGPGRPPRGPIRGGETGSPFRRKPRMGFLVSPAQGPGRTRPAEISLGAGGHSGGGSGREDDREAELQPQKQEGRPRRGDRVSGDSRGGHTDRVGLESRHTRPGRRRSNRPAAGAPEANSPWPEEGGGRLPRGDPPKDRAVPSSGIWGNAAAPRGGPQGTAVEAGTPVFHEGPLGAVWLLNPSRGLLGYAVGRSGETQPGLRRLQPEPELLQTVLSRPWPWLEAPGGGAALRRLHPARARPTGSIGHCLTQQTLPFSRGGCAVQPARRKESRRGAEGRGDRVDRGSGGPRGHSPVPALCHRVDASQWE